MGQLDVQRISASLKNNGVFWIFCIFAIVIIARGLLGIHTPFDSKDEYYPLLKYAVTQLENGNNPFWNAAHFSGFPVAGDPQSLVFSPLMIAGMMIIGKSAFAYDILVYFHLFLGAIAVYFFAKHKAAPWYIGVLAAVIFAFGSVAAARLQHTPIIIAYSYFAMFFYAYSHRNYSLSNMFLCGILLGLTLIHINQVVFILCLFCIIWFGYLLYSDDNNRKRLMLFSAGMGFVAVLISAIPLYNIIATKAESVRGAIDYTIATWHSPAPKMLLSMFFPNINQNILGQYPGPSDMTETYLHIGILPVLIILYAMFFLKETKKNLMASIALGLLFIISVMFALGKNGLIFPAYYYLPGADNFRRPSDFLFLSNFLFCLWLIFSWKRFKAENAFPHKQMVFTCVVATVLLMTPNAVNRLNSTQHLSHYYQTTAQQEVIDIIKKDDKDALGVPYRLEALGTQMYWANYAINDGIYLVYGYNPMSSKLLNDVYGIPETFFAQKTYTKYYNSYGDWLPKLMGIGYVLTSHKIEDLEKINAIELMKLGNVYLYKLATPYNRVLNPQYRLPESTPIQELNSIDFNDHYISDNQDLDQCNGKVIIQQVSYDGADVAIKYQSDTGGILVVNEIYNTRVQAEVDDQSVNVHKVNHMMRGMCVPAGEHNLTMGYKLLPVL